MRNNLPVTATEYTLRPDITIISRTDAGGRILWVNDDFIDASGFTEAELLGQPHNIVRHPDMPAEGFRDLWATLKEGRPWTGFVKNRRKNGDYYWVKATATPAADGGYTSVRVAASRAEIAFASTLYQRMRDNPGIRLWRGGLAPRGVFERLGVLAGRLSIGWRIGLLFLATALLSSAQAALALAGLDSPAASLGLLLAGLALTASLAAWTVTSIRRPLRIAMEAAERIANKDLAQTVPQGDDSESGQLLVAMAKMRNNLLEVASRIRDNSGKLQATVHALRATAGRTAQASDEQATAASSMAAAVEELSASIGHIGDNAEEARQVADAAGNTSGEGGEVIGRTADEMREIAAAVNAAATSLRELEQLSGEISNITTAISGIAEQTNLLALNAAIEAARAGETGRGFAVVADEVRKLAERTGQSTLEITGLVHRIREGTQNAAADMDASVQRVGMGVDLAQQAGTAVGSIRDSAQRVGIVVGDITIALSQQAGAASELSSNVAVVAGLADQNATAAHSVEVESLAVERLSAQLSELTGAFRVT